MTRCADCQAVIDRMREQGYQYSARQEGSGPWEATFLGARVRRATGVTLHDAIQAAGATFAVRVKD